MHDMKKLLFTSLLILFFVSQSFSIEVFREEKEIHSRDVVLVYISDNKYDTKLNAIVYITEYKSEAGDKMYLWHFTKARYAHNVTRIFFTKNKYEADWIIYITNTKSEAEWIK
jgi:hypothetical protein